MPFFGLYPCSTKMREVLGNPSPTPKRFPETREISRGLCSEFLRTILLAARQPPTDLQCACRFYHTLNTVHCTQCTLKAEHCRSSDCRLQCCEDRSRRRRGRGKPRTHRTSKHPALHCNACSVLIHWILGQIAIITLWGKRGVQRSNMKTLEV